MKKLLLVLGFLLPMAGYAQGGFGSGYAFQNSNGYAELLPGASITICQYNAQNLCLTTVGIYSNNSLSTPIPNPTNADVNGYYSFFTSTGIYTQRICAAAGGCVNTTIAVSFASSDVLSVNNILPVSGNITLTSVNINYTPAATGGQTRTQASKDGDLVSVKDFGAKMDGTTDDSAALQACVNATGQTCYIPVGTLKYATTLSFTLTTYGAAHLICASRASVLKYTGSGDAIAALGTGQTNPGLTIQNCTVNGASSTGSANGLHVRAFSDGLIENVMFTSFAGGDAVLNEGANSLSFLNDSCINSINGIHNRSVVVSSVPFASNANHFIGGVVGGNTKWGVFDDGSVTAAGPDENNVYELVFETNGTNGTPSGQIFLQDCDMCAVTHSYIEYPSSGSLAPYSIVIGGVAGDAIGGLAFNGDRPVITDNWFASFGQPSVKVLGATGYTITDNTDVGTPTYFLDIGDASTQSGGTVLRNRAAAATIGFMRGPDSSGVLISDGTTGLNNTVIPTAFGMGYTAIANAVANTPVVLRGNGGTQIAAFLSAAGANVAGIDNTGKATLTGFNGMAVDSPGFKYASIASCTTAASLYATCNTVWTFTTAFANLSFVTVCSPAGNIGGPVTVIDQPTRTVGSVTITIANYGTNASASSTTLACVALHP
jgi:Pectate lyase superfamily protein